MIDAGGDQRRRVRSAPETVHQCSDPQVAEVTIVLHLLTGHEYPSSILAGILIRALSAHPESCEVGIIRRVKDIQSRSVRSRRHTIVRKAILKDPVPPIVKR